MISREDIYDSILKYQVDFSMEQEITILKDTNWSNSKKVLDYGCGNGYYLSKLADKYPDKTFWGCDKNPEILKKVKVQSNTTFLCGEYPSLNIPDDIDFFIVRYLTSYLPDRIEFFKWIKEHSSGHASILLVDAFDDELTVKPYLPMFMKGQDAFIDSVNEGGGCRDLIKTCTQELSQLGFSLIDTKSIVVNSSAPYIKEKIFAYMCLIAEIDNGSVISSELADELIRWLIDPDAFLQYGSFVSLYQL